MDGNLITYLFLVILGASVGSFLNVLAVRLPKGEQVLKGRSHCDHCRHKLSWQDLFPIVSWIILRGRCRYCQSPISPQHPLVELSTGLLFMVTFLFFSRLNHELGIMNYGLSEWASLAYFLWVISSLIVIVLADLKYQIIPDQIVYPTLLISLVFLILNPTFIHNSDFLILNSIYSALGAGLFFGLIVLATRGRGMGIGDVKLVILMGFILGFPNIIVALYLAFLTGAIAGVILILTGKKRFGQHVPFGPFLAVATYVSLFGGENLWQIFQKLLGL